MVERLTWSPDLVTYDYDATVDIGCEAGYYLDGYSQRTVNIKCSEDATNLTHGVWNIAPASITCISMIPACLITYPENIIIQILQWRR